MRHNARQSDNNTKSPQLFPIISKVTHSPYGPCGLNSICEDFDFQLPREITLNLKKTSCKQFYKRFEEEIKTEPTVIKSTELHP